MTYSVETFRMDRLARDKYGVPIGRVVLRDDNYVKGSKLEIALLSLHGKDKVDEKTFKFYIDGVKYRIVKVNGKRKDANMNSVVLSNLIAEVV